MEQETDKKKDVKECEVEYDVGDLLWAKLGHFPYWPCMVTYDPLEGYYYKKIKYRSKDAIAYHIQYFGKKAQHGYTVPGFIMPYEGQKAFYDKKAELMATKSSHSTVPAGYNIPKKILKEWTIAVNEADEAKQYEVDERYESYVFKYYESRKSTPTEKSTKKRKSSWGSAKKPKKAKELNFTDLRVCKICGKGDVDLSCLGSCSEYFHKDCLGLLVAPNNFTCLQCQKGLETCFVCKKACNFTVFNCKKCDLKYHPSCILDFPCFQTVKNMCSYHACLTCEKLKLSPKWKTSGALVKCIRCPTSFHATVSCLPAGAVRLSASTMICPDHFYGKNRVSPLDTCNVSYCFSCSEGGELICCESCPNAFHAECLVNFEVPDDDFFCDDCKEREFLYVGMVVWAKTGNYRWWPAQIADVEDLPVNVKNIKHYSGEFPVQYFGTEEFVWTHRGRVIPYSWNHKDFHHKNPKQCRLDKCFSESLKQASDAYDQFKEKQRVLAADKRNHYKHIQVNRLVPPAQIDASVTKSFPCKCDKIEPFYCCPSSKCFNFSMKTECHPKLCQCGEKCENQKFQRRQYAKVKVVKTENRGCGLVADELISKGTFIIEYVGEIITHAEYRKRVVEMRERNEQNYYFLYLDSRRMIDAGPAGNYARFINHACTANCVMDKWSVNGDARIGIFAKENILPGQELTFNYQYDDVCFEQKCLCGTENCQGLFGKSAKKGKGSKEGPKKKSKDKVKKKK